LEEMKMRLRNGYEWREENEKKVMSVWLKRGCGVVWFLMVILKCCEILTRKQKMLVSVWSLFLDRNRICFCIALENNYFFFSVYFHASVGMSPIIRCSCPIVKMKKSGASFTQS
jgi:hypothetical protein